MTIFCGDCEFVSLKENHPKTDYHECTKYKKRLYHNGRHPNLYRAPVCILLTEITVVPTLPSSRQVRYVDDSDI
jgi:hypothetical protein